MATKTETNEAFLKAELERVEGELAVALKRCTDLSRQLHEREQRVTDLRYKLDERPLTMAQVADLLKAMVQ